MMHGHGGVFLAAAMISGTAYAPMPAMAQPAMAQALGVTFEGEARTGSDTRAVRFRFFCSSNEGPNVTGVLDVSLEIPRYEQLRGIFDFDPFEGPDAKAGALTTLQSSGPRGTASDRSSVAGSAVGDGKALSFSLEWAASRREPSSLRKLAIVLGPLIAGPAKLVWIQGNAKRGGTPMTATLNLLPEQSDQLRAAVAPCLK